MSRKFYNKIQCLLLFDFRWRFYGMLCDDPALTSAMFSAVTSTFLNKPPNAERAALNASDMLCASRGYVAIIIYSGHFKEEIYCLPR